MAIWVQRQGWWWLWLWAYRVRCSHCRHLEQGLRLTREQATGRAIRAETAHYVECPARPYNQVQKRKLT